MYFISNLWGCAPNLFFSRGISCTSSCHANHYLTLGVTPGSSQEEIKAAYFELCKKYHPDKNDGSEESARLFRNISEAYKVLGKFLLRMNNFLFRNIEWFSMSLTVIGIKSNSK